MSMLSQLFTSGFSEVVQTVDTVIDKYVQTPDEKQQAAREVWEVTERAATRMLQEVSAELDAKTKVAVAEAQQDDKFVKRARPSIIYMGLIVIFFNYLVAPLVFRLTGADETPLALPVEFWSVWGGVATTYIIGRTAERVAPGGKLDSIFNAVSFTKKLLKKAR